MKPVHLFVGPRLKIKRADKHIRDLQCGVEAFLQTDFYRLTVKEDSDTGDSFLQCEFIADVPEDFALIIGDAVHNLHTALDLMTYEVLTSGGRITAKETRKLKFPFREKRKELIGAVQNGPIQGAGDDIVKLIVNVVQPYRRGNDSLYGLHDLDVADKHWILLPVLSMVSVDGVCAQSEDGRAIKNWAMMAKTGRVSAGIWSVKGKIKITDYGKPSFDVLFGDRSPFRSQSVLPTLHQLSQLVSGIVDQFEKVILSRA